MTVLLGVSSMIYGDLIMALPFAQMLPTPTGIPHGCSTWSKIQRVFIRDRNRGSEGERTLFCPHPLKKLLTSVSLFNLNLKLF